MKNYHIFYLINAFMLCIFYCSAMMDYLVIGDVSGYIKYNFADAGFVLRTNCKDLSYAQLMYENTDIYAKWNSKEKYYMCKLDFTRVSTVKLLELLDARCSRSQNLAEVLQTYGLGTTKFVGKHKGWLSKIFDACEVVAQDGKYVINTDTMLDVDCDVDNPQKITEPVYPKVVYQKTSFFEKCKYTAFGFALAIPCFYMYWKFSK